MTTTFKPAWEQRMNKCKNYSGLMNDKCHAGVEYHSFPKEKGKTPFESYPCLLQNNMGHKCPLAVFRTEEEARAEIAQAYENLNNFFKKIEEGICPECGRGMESKQVGRCVYASPCGHRLYQGKVKKVT